MWIVIGLVLLIGSFIYFLRTRWRADWESEKGTMPAAIPKMYWQLTSGPGGIYRLGLACPEHFDFMMGKERLIERLFKQLGLIYELELQQADFDRVVFVSCDDLYVQRLLRRSEAARSAIQRIMLRDRSGRTRRVTLHARGGRVWLEAKLELATAAEALCSVIREDSADLHVLAEALSSLPTALIFPINRRVRRNAFALMTVPLAMLFSAAMGWLHYFFSSYEQLRLFDLITDSLLTALLVWGGMLLAAVLLLVRTSWFHVVFLELLLLGGVASLASIASVRLHVNIAHDMTERVVHCILVVDKTTKKRRGGVRSYYAKLADWQLVDGQLISKHRIRISADTYQALRIGEIVSLSEHPGSLGYPWLDGFQKGCSKYK